MKMKDAVEDAGSSGHTSCQDQRSRFPPSSVFQLLDFWGTVHRLLVVQARDFI